MKPSKTTDCFSVLIPDGESPQALSVNRCLGEMKNVKTFVLSRNKYAPIRFSRYTKRFIYLKDKNTKEERLEAIIDTIKKTNIDIVLPVDVETIRLISEYKDKFSNLTSIAPIPDLESIDIANDKWLLSLWLNENNISHPSTILYKSDTNLDKTISSISFPVLIKPRDGYSGKGIKKFENAIELENFYRGDLHSEKFIVQSFIKGYDIDCSVLCSGGRILAHTIQKSLMFESYGFSSPSAIEFLNHDKIYNIVKKVVERFNWDGIVHIDLRYDQTDQQVKIIELNPRFWGSVSASMFAGVNFPYLACLSSLKRDIPVINTRQIRVVRTGAAIKMIFKRVFSKQKDLFFDNSYLEFTIKDPIPEIFNKYLILYKNIISKRRWIFKLFIKMKENSSHISG